MTDIIKNVSTLTTIPERNLNKLRDIIIYSINDSVEEKLIENENIDEINLGIGILTIWFKDNEIKFKFKPNAKLEESLINTIINKKNILEQVLEDTLVNKITNTYKDLL